MVDESWYLVVVGTWYYRLLWLWTKSNRPVFWILAYWWFFLLFL